MNDKLLRANQPDFRLIPETATFLELCIAACCGWIFIRLAAKVKGGATKELDETILQMLRHRDNPAIPRGPKWLYQAFHDITSLGSGTNLTLASGIAVGFLCLRRRFRAAGFLIVSLGSGLMLSYLLKNFFVRERPTVVPRLTHFDPGSFPSGHSMGAALVYLTLGGIMSRQSRRLLSKAYYLSVALGLSTLVGISRVYLGVHFPSDVLAGWAVGSLWSTICTQAARRLQREGKVEPPGTSIESGLESTEVNDRAQSNRFTTMTQRTLS
jgi:undecaprenyl-diphosphatase